MPPRPRTLHSKIRLQYKLAKIEIESWYRIIFWSKERLERTEAAEMEILKLIPGLVRD